MLVTMRGRGQGAGGREEGASGRGLSPFLESAEEKGTVPFARAAGEGRGLSPFSESAEKKGTVPFCAANSFSTRIRSPCTSSSIFPSPGLDSQAGNRSGTCDVNRARSSHSGSMSAGRGQTMSNAWVPPRRARQRPARSLSPRLRRAWPRVLPSRRPPLRRTPRLPAIVRPTPTAGQLLRLPSATQPCSSADAVFVKPPCHRDAKPLTIAHNSRPNTGG